jgi:hypothetical protein
MPNTTAKNMLHSKHKGTISQANKILHHLYHQATAILGDDATFAEIASKMNILSTVDDAQPTINLDNLGISMSLQSAFE